MTYPTKITVTKAGQEVFSAESGRLGHPDSAARNFVCFASPIIGASWHYAACDTAAQRIAEMGYSTTIVHDGIKSLTPAAIH